MKEESLSLLARTCSESPVSYAVEHERHIHVSMKRRSGRLPGSLAAITALIAASLAFVPLAGHNASVEETRNASTASLSAERIQQDDPQEAPLEEVWPSVSEPWTGDLDGMLERGEIRVLTALSLGAYYIDRGRASGAIHEAIGLFEKFVKNKAISVRSHTTLLVFSPVSCVVAAVT
jgi:hypothetical protein